MNSLLDEALAAQATAVSPLTVCQVVLDQVRGALEACGADPLNRVHVAAGFVAWDDCCGMLVTAPERIYRTAIFPNEGPDPNGCFDGFIAVDTVTLLVRCVSVLDDRGQPPSVAALAADYGEVLWEAGIVWDSLVQALPNEWESANLSQAFTGAEGGCIGVETRLTVGVDETVWCPCQPIAP